MGDGEAVLNEALAAGREWLELGVRVVVCDGKNPGALLGRDWQRQATDDEERLREWLTRWPDSNLGVVPGNAILLIDVDDPAKLAELEAALGPTPPTPRYYTNGDPDTLRERLVLRHPGVELRKSALGDGLEVRAGDLMSVVPPSVNPKTGDAYEWRVALDEAPLCALPDAWLAYASSRNGHGPAAVVPDVIPHGVQHRTLVSFAGSMRRRGANTEEIAAALTVMNRRCERPGTDAEMLAIAASMERYEPESVTTKGSAAAEEFVRGATATTKGLAVVAEVLKPLDEALRGTPERVEWLWDGYLPAAGLTGLAGRPKVGKSYLVFGLLAALRRGEAFLRRATTPTGVALLSEERPATLREKRDHFGLTDGVEVVMRHEVAGMPWPELVDQAVTCCRERGLGLLVIDTWDKWAGLSGEQENAAGAVNQAVAPLLSAANELAIWLVTHQRKSGGKHGEAVRGSNALAGAVDVLLELERLGGADENARVLYAVSRYADTPAEMGVRFVEDGYEVGETTVLRTADSRRRVLEGLAELEVATVPDLCGETDLAESTVRRRLKELEREKVVLSDSSKSPSEWRHHHESLGGGGDARHEHDDLSRAGAQAWPGTDSTGGRP